ncbi:MAG: hypothetical protein ACJA11_002717 [Glaciecola sp.]
MLAENERMIIAPKIDVNRRFVTTEHTIDSISAAKSALSGKIFKFYRLALIS